MLPLKNLKTKMPAVLIVTGSLLLGYVAVQYGTMLHQQKRLEREWAAQQERPSPGTVEARSHASDDGLTRLSIPRLNFSAVVVEGTSRRQLLLGPGHMPKTAVPGTPGNSVITGHRDTFFRHIIDLNKGDRILVQRSGNSYAYEVSYKKVVKPTDLWVTQPSSDARLTLLTCYPIYYIGPAPERLVVVARLVQPADAPAKIAASAAVPVSANDPAQHSRKQ